MGPYFRGLVVLFFGKVDLRDDVYAKAPGSCIFGELCGLFATSESVIFEWLVVLLS